MAREAAQDSCFPVELFTTFFCLFFMPCLVMSLPACDSGFIMITPLPLQMLCWPFRSAPVLWLAI